MYWGLNIPAEFWTARCKCPLQACPCSCDAGGPWLRGPFLAVTNFPSKLQDILFPVAPSLIFTYGVWVDSLSGSEMSLERQGAQIQQLYGTGSLPIKLQGWRFSPCKRLVKDFSYEEEIHMLFAQRLESGPRNLIPSSGQPT